MNQHDPSHTAHHGQPAGHDTGDHHDQGPAPDSAAGRRKLNRLAISAAAHCLTGCAIGEILG